MNSDKLFTLKALQGQVKVLDKKLKAGILVETEKLQQEMEKLGKNEMTLDNDAKVEFIPGTTTATKEIDLKKIEKENPVLYTQLLDN